MSSPARRRALLNRGYIREVLLRAGKGYCYSHVSREDLAADPAFLGVGLLYYAMSYMIKSRLSVCLGSGDGFVPNLLRQAQNDLNNGGRTILIDADLPELGYGKPHWIQNPDMLLPDIEVFLERTDQSVLRFKEQDLTIDYLHIDADHSYEGCMLDFMSYKDLVSPRGIISLHDTQPDRDAFLKVDIGVPKVIEHIRTLDEFEVMDFPFQGAGTAFVQRKQT